MTTTRKKKMLIVLAIALAALFTVGATLAYLTDLDSVLNTLGIGGATTNGDAVIDIMITEPGFDTVVTKNGGINGKLNNLLPGTEIYKDPTVENTGMLDVYARVKFYTDDPSAATPGTRITLAQMEKNYGVAFTSAWTKHKDDTAATEEDTLYYTGTTPGACAILTPATGTVPVFTEKNATVIPSSYISGSKYTMTIPITAANNETITLFVVVEAVQADYFTPLAVAPATTTDCWRQDNGSGTTIDVPILKFA